MHRPDTVSGAIERLGLSQDHPLAIAPAGRYTVEDLLLDGRGGSATAETVALCFADPLSFLREIVARDGCCAAMLLLNAALDSDQVERLARSAGATRIAADRPELKALGLPPGENTASPAAGPTRWLLTTSGTTGESKLVAHDFRSVSRTVRAGGSASGARWGLVYEPSRFAAIQVMLQALLGGGTLLLPDRAWPLADQIAWLAAQGCTHLSATPAWWRLLLMTPGSSRLPLAQITLGGEIADGPCLSALRGAFPEARITHVYASTELGVGFSVQDGKPGFPAAWLDAGVPAAALAIREGLLWLRPHDDAAGPRRAAHIERDGDGFVCSRDRVELIGDRVCFLGRDDASINVGGVKIFAEQVEAVIHGHPGVGQCRIEARPSSLLGNVLQLTVVPRDPAADGAQLCRDVRQWCADRLARAARPATIRIADRIDISPAGKVVRRAGA